MSVSERGPVDGASVEDRSRQARAHVVAVSALVQRHGGRLCSLADSALFVTFTAATGGPPEVPTDLAVRAADLRDTQALLLLMADQKRFEETVFIALLDSSASVRRDMAVALGRIGDRRGRGLLHGGGDRSMPSSGSGNDSGGEVAPATTDMDAVAKDDKRKPEIKEVCKKKTTGKGKAKKTENICEMVDSNPKLSASIGIASLTKGFTWGMSPDAVLAKLGESINKGFDDQLKETKDPMGQDRIRKERNEQLNELKKGNVKFSGCLLYTSPSPRDRTRSRMPSSA